MPEGLFRQTLYTICRYFVENEQGSFQASHVNLVFEFVFVEFQLQPKFIQYSLWFLTILLGIMGFVYGGRPLGSLPQTRQKNYLRFCCSSSFILIRLVIRFYRSLILLRLYEEPSDVKSVDRAVSRTVHDTNQSSEIVVVGSGPGGAITAALLAETGHEVALLEEGEWPDSKTPYSTGEMITSMRWGGLGVIAGRVPINIVEGRCVGGGSEINSGFYLRPPVEVLEGWDLTECTLSKLLPFFEANERELGVSVFNGNQPDTASKLQLGAKLLQWETENVQKWRDFESHKPWTDDDRGAYRSMSNTFIPRFLNSGGRLYTGQRVINLADDGHWRLRVAARDKSTKDLKANVLVLAAGALQTPRILQRSGIDRRKVGHGLQSSLVAKVIAEFPEPVNCKELGMPTIQVREFSPLLTFGCAFSSLSQLMIGLSGYECLPIDPVTNWRRLAIYSVILTPTGRGYVGPTGVRFKPTREDWCGLREGLIKLMELLLVAGAIRLYPVVEKGVILESSADIQKIDKNLQDLRPQLLALHPVSSCAMGNNPCSHVVSENGFVYSQRKLMIADASILPGYPGANPQATLMAVVRRNAELFAENYVH